MNPNLRASDARQKSVFGEGDIKITASIWMTLSLWNASRVLTSGGFALYKQEKKLIQEMETNPIALERIKLKAVWVKTVLNAIIKKEGSSDFIVGESSTNWPKIKEPAYNHGISLVELTRIIQEHRQAVKSWSQQQTQNKQKKPSPSLKSVAVEELVKPDAVVPESWEDAVEESVKPDVVVPESWEDAADE
jgi:hypothetical protein